jgi:protein phosphatase
MTAQEGQTKSGELLVSSFDQIEQASLTDVGVRRSHNQDNLAVHLATDVEQWHKNGHLFLVADGMGGHAVGEKASEMASSVVPHTYHKHAQDGAAAALRKAFLEANATIHACGEQNREFLGMGTTGTALVLRPDGAWIGHVGDSRTYRIRHGVIEQLTYDHSYVWEIARLKNVDPSEIQDFPTNVIHRCLGPQPLVQVDIEGPHEVEPGDVYLLCSDGLSGQVTDPEMGVVASLLPPKEACQFLIDLANLRGGPDNITVIIVRVGGQPTRPVPPPRPRPLRPPPWARVPWPLLSLVGGCLLAALAIYLWVVSPASKALPGLLLLLALVTTGAGLVGLWLHSKKQTRRSEEESQGPHVYVHKACEINRDLLDKVARAEQTLKQRVEEKHWEIDLPAYEEHHELAERRRKEGDLAGAFCEYCRAMRPLNVALQKYRSKEELFQPVWDKA